MIDGIQEAKAQDGERYTIKQLEKSRKSLEARMAKLNDQSRKDDVITFEELGRRPAVCGRGSHGVQEPVPGTRKCGMWQEYRHSRKPSEVR